ncbi:MAG: hypothetical protein AAGG46_12800, partial [Planctomycetota bacterium]
MARLPAITAQSNLKQLDNFTESLDDGVHLRANKDTKVLYDKADKGSGLKKLVKHGVSTDTGNSGQTRRQKFDTAKTIVRSILVGEVGEKDADSILASVLKGPKTIGAFGKSYGRVEAMTKADLQEIVKQAKDLKNTTINTNPLNPANRANARPGPIQSRPMQTSTGQT